MDRREDLQQNEERSRRSAARPTKVVAVLHVRNQHAHRDGKDRRQHAPQHENDPPLGRQRSIRLRHSGEKLAFLAAQEDASARVNPTTGPGEPISVSPPLSPAHDARRQSIPLLPRSRIIRLQSDWLPRSARPQAPSERRYGAFRGPITPCLKVARLLLGDNGRRRGACAPNRRPVVPGGGELFSFREKCDQLEVVVSRAEVRTSSRSGQVQSRITSFPAVTTRVPAGLKAMLQTGDLWPTSERASVPFSRSQILTDFSGQLERRYFPSGLNARPAARTDGVPFRLRISLPVLASQSLTVSSVLLLARRSLRGLNAIVVTGPRWPL